MTAGTTLFASELLRKPIRGKGATMGVFVATCAPLNLAKNVANPPKSSPLSLGLFTVTRFASVLSVSSCKIKARPFSMVERLCMGVAEFNRGMAGRAILRSLENTSMGVFMARIATLPDSTKATRRPRRRVLMALRTIYPLVSPIENEPSGRMGCSGEIVGCKCSARVTIQTLHDLPLATYKLPRVRICMTLLALVRLAARETQLEGRELWSVALRAFQITVGILKSKAARSVQKDRQLRLLLRKG